LEPDSLCGPSVLFNFERMGLNQESHGSIPRHLNALYRILYDHDKAGEPVHAFTGVPEMLKTLHEGGYTIVVVSGKAETAMKAESDSCGLNESIDALRGTDPKGEGIALHDIISAVLVEKGLGRLDAFGIAGTKADAFEMTTGGIRCVLGATWGIKDEQKRDALNSSCVSEIVSAPTSMVDVLNRFDKCSLSVGRKIELKRYNCGD